MKIWKVILRKGNGNLLKKWYYETEKQYNKWIILHKIQWEPAGFQVDSYVIEAEESWKKL